MCMFAVSVLCTKRVSWALVHAVVYFPQVFLTSPYISTNHCRECTCDRACAVCSFALGDEGGEVQLVNTVQSTCRLAWGLASIEGEIKVLSFVFIFLTLVGVYLGVHMCDTHTHTHAVYGVLDVSPGIGTRHFEGPKNQERLNLVKFVFIHVYKVHMCIYMPWGKMRSRLTAFFYLCYLNIFSKKQSKRCDHKTPMSQI